MDDRLQKMMKKDGVTEFMVLEEMQNRPWKQRHDDTQERKENTRNRIRNASVTEGTVIRKPKPRPTMNDDSFKRVAVYARVSTASEMQVSSIENQTKYYTEKVAEKENWDLTRIYADEGKSGTSMKHRTEFRELLKDASEGKIDLILCASVSRFARNVTDCINEIEHLQTNDPKHPVGVYFETEGIYTLDPNSKMALYIHAMLADWESDNKSKRMILSYDQRICTGQYPLSDLLGYRHTKDGELLVVEDEAMTIRYIFYAYLSGQSLQQIADTMTEKKRKTLTGRTDWNPSMVRAIMGNERRWGDLEARKTVCINYKEKKSVKNDNIRCSAFVPEHHEGIVSRSVANAVHYISGNGKLSGVPEISVIEEGALKGFVSVLQGFGGVDSELYMDFCRNAYPEEERTRIEHEAGIIRGEEHSYTISMDLAGYEVPSSAFFIDSNSPTITFSRRHLKVNKRFHQRFEGSEYVQILYHPLLQALLIRTCDESDSGAIPLVNENGNPCELFHTEAFCNVVYEQLDWMEDYSFRFRGISRTRNGKTMMMFYLDEPQIIAKGVKGIPAGGAHYIQYRKHCQGNSEERQELRFGTLYAARKSRKDVMTNMTEKDMFQKGRIKVNPLTGDIPSKEFIMKEVDSLLMSM